MNTLHTLGYARWTLDQVEAAVLDLDAILLDIRMHPFSRKPGFSKSALARQFGDRYRHVEALGNVNYRRGPIEINDPDLGLFALEQHLQRQAVILMCGCADVHTCHRKTVAMLAVKRFGVLTVQHLEPPEAIPA